MNFGSTHRDWLTFFLISVVALSALSGFVSLTGHAPTLTDNPAAPSSVGADALDGPPFHDLPNAVPYLFDEPTLARAAERIEELALLPPVDSLPYSDISPGK